MGWVRKVVRNSRRVWHATSSNYDLQRIARTHGMSRLVEKRGDCNISMVNVPEEARSWHAQLNNMFITLVEMRWRWCMIMFSASIVALWLIWGTIYYVVSVLIHRDFDHLYQVVYANTTGVLVPHYHDDWTPCLGNAYSLIDMYIFAFTTGTTIGYGYQYPTDECPLLIMAMCGEFIVALFNQALLVGVIFAKLSRPKKRAEMLMFSEKAVVSMRGGKLCLLFRVGNTRKTALAEAHIRLLLIRMHITPEGELIPFKQFNMRAGFDSDSSSFTQATSLFPLAAPSQQQLDRLLLLWPITIVHEIDVASPLYDMDKEAMRKAHFEIIAVLEAVVEGSTTQARTSYLPSEIEWGKRFHKMVAYRKDRGAYWIDFGRFHSVYDVPTPAHSAKEQENQRMMAMARTGDSVLAEGLNGPRRIMPRNVSLPWMMAPHPMGGGGGGVGGGGSSHAGSPYAGRSHRIGSGPLSGGSRPGHFASSPRSMSDYTVSEEEDLSAIQSPDTDDTDIQSSTAPTLTSPSNEADMQFAGGGPRFQMAKAVLERTRTDSIESTNGLVMETILRRPGSKV